MIKVQKFLHIFMVMAMLLGLFAVPMQAAPGPNTQETTAIVAQQTDGDDDPQPTPTPPTKKRIDESQLQSVNPSDIVAVRPTHTKGEVVGEVRDASGLARYIIVLQEPALANYKGGIPGLAPTSIEATGDNKLNVQSAASRAYVQYLEGKQAQFVTSLERDMGRTLAVAYRFQHAVNGLVATLTPEEAAKIAQMPEVYLVERERDLPLDTDVGPDWIGATGIWDGSTTGTATKGEGIVVGIIDSGVNVINPTVHMGKTYAGHPSFVDPGPLDGYVYPAPAQFYGVCNPSSSDYDPTFPCNNKLIGAYDMQNDNVLDPNAPRDDNGHGSHTASTVAGNVITATIDAPTTTTQRIVSGMAPHAQIIAYDACYTASDGRGLCPNTATTAAANQAVADGVINVINFSIGGGETPWSDSTSLAFLACRAAGIYVATSAGNEGPGAGTVGHNEPWVASTGAATHNRTYNNSLINMTGDGTPPADITGKGFTAGYGPATIVYAGNYTSTIANDALCLNPFPAGTWTNGEIVVCDRGTNARVEKGQNVLAGGAGGYVLANDAANGDALTGDSHFLPAVHITYNDGVTLKAWLASGATHMATIGGAQLVIDPNLADIMADFSSRGPSTVPGLLKPNIIAPGVDVLATIQTEAGFDFYGGTSMASPHHAGAAALLMALHPEWTPAQIQSALMTTAYRDEIYKEDGATEADPHDRGSGRVDLSKAALAGLVLDESVANFTAADPDNGGDPKTLNLASMANDRCLNECSWTRVVSSTQNAAVNWTVTVTGTAGMTITVNPASFSLAAYAQQTLVITADVSSLPAGTWVFGEVILTPDDPNIPAAHLTLGVKPTTGILPDYVRFDTRRNAGSELIQGLQTFEVITLTTQSFGLIQADLDTLGLGEHAKPTTNFPDIFFTDTGNVYVQALNVAAGDMRLVAEVANTTSPDLDMLLMFDADDDGTPELADTTAFPGYCQSAVGGPWEYCSISNPQAGRWFVMVINYTASQAGQPDDIVLATAIVPNTDGGNMTIAGPQAVPASTPFDVRLFWNTPTMVAGDRWYGAFSLGSEPGQEGNIGTVPVDIIRAADDVVKTADKDGAFYGETVEYTIVVQPNITPEDLTYRITDTIPAGLTYVPGSAAASAGTVNVVGNQLTWTGLVYSPSGAAGGYNVTTNATDPLCDTGFGGYVNLNDFGINPQSALQGDQEAWTAFATQAPIPFYNVDQTGLGFTTDGFVYFDAASLALPANTNIPNPANPNEIAPILWSDLNVVYQANTRGISLASAGSTVSIVEYDDVEIAGASGTIVGDFEIVVFGGPIDNAPGAYEIVYAYDNIQNLPASVTVGVENLDASSGSEFLYGDPTGVITNGLIVCFDYFQATYDPITITYRVQVDNTVPGSPLTNVVVHTVDNEGSLPAETSFDLHILGNAVKNVSDTLINPGELVTYTIVLTAGPEAALWALNDVIPSGFGFVNVQGANYVSATNSIEWSGYLGSGVVMMTEGFEDATFPPAGWATFRGVNGLGTGYDWVRDTTAPYAGAAAAFVRYENVTGGLAQDWLVTPQFMPTASAPAIQFYMRQSFIADYGTTYTVRVSTASQTNHSDFAIVQTYTESDFGTTYQPFSVDLSAYIGQNIYVAFVMEQDDGDSWYIDNVSWAESVVYPDTHVVTLTLQGETPGTYVNVAEIGTQGFDLEVEAPAVVVYGPVPAWNKEVWINGQGPALPGTHNVVPGDRVTIVDRVNIAFNDTITFTLLEEWDALLNLVDYDADLGSVTPGAGTLTWQVVGGAADTWHAITKTFEVVAGLGWDGAITETLNVEGYPTTLETPVALHIPALLGKDGPATADNGEVITYTISIETLSGIGGSAQLVDPLPDGLECISETVKASYGTAWYDANDNTVYWGAALGITALGHTPEVDRTIAARTRAEAQQDVRITDIRPADSSTAVDIIKDGGFELGTPNPHWTEYSSNGWDLISDYLPSTGVYGVWMGGDEDENAILTQTVTIPADGTANLSFWLLIGSTNTDSPDADWFQVRLGDTVVFTATAADIDSYGGNYHQIVIDVSALADGVARDLIFEAYIHDDTTSNTNFFLDDVMLEFSPPTNATITFNARVTGAAGEVITNTAELKYMGTVQQALTVLEVNDSSSELEITKSVTPAADLDLGDMVTYTIALVNTGARTAQGILLTDTLPTGIVFDAFVENDGNAQENAGVITWNGDLPAGETLTIVFTAMVADDSALLGTTITNQVVFTSENAGDGLDTASLTVGSLYKVFLPVVMRDFNH